MILTMQADTPENITYHTPQSDSMQPSIEPQQLNTHVEDDSQSAGRRSPSIDVQQLRNSTEAVEGTDDAIQSSIETQPLDLPIEVADQADMTRQLSHKPKNPDIRAGYAAHSSIIEDLYQAFSTSQLQVDDGAFLQSDSDSPSDDELATGSKPSISLVAKQAIERVCSYKKAHPLSGNSDCISIAVEYAESKGIDNDALFKSLSSIALGYETIGELSKSFMTSLLVAAGYEVRYGTKHPSTLNEIHHLVLVVWKFPRSEAVVSLYRAAIKGCENLGLHSLQLKNQALLGELLQYLGWGHEAIDMYISVFVSYLRTFPCGYGYSRGFCCLLTYMSDFYLDIRSRSGWEVVARSAILHILDAVQNGNRALQGNTSPLSAKAVIIFHSTKLAREYSALKSFDIAKTLFSAILQIFDDSWTHVDGMLVRAMTYMEYALHCQRWGFQKESEEYFLLAHIYLGRWEKEEVDLEEMFKSHLADLQKQLGAETPEILTRKVSAMLSPLSISTYLNTSNGRPRVWTPRITDKTTALPTSDLSPSSTDSVENADENAPQILTLKIRDIFADFPTSAFWSSSNRPMKSWADSTDTKSYKYGVTYSASEITGISYSEFMVP